MKYFSAINANLALVILCSLSILLFGFLREIMFPVQNTEPAFFVVVFAMLFWLVAASYSAHLSRKLRVGIYLLTNLAFLCIWLFSWTPRQQFFRDLTGIDPGMSVVEVEGRLARFHPVKSSVFNGSAGPSARPIEPVVSDTIVYVRDISSTTYNDLGLITFEAGKVQKVTEVID
jgi:hypothetical protein